MYIIHIFVMPKYILRVFRCRKSVSTNDNLDKCLYMYKIKVILYLLQCNRKSYFKIFRYTCIVDEFLTQIYENVIIR